MKNRAINLLFLFGMALILSGCHTIGEKNASMCSIYGITSVLSFALLIGYYRFVTQRNVWFLLLSISIAVVNVGYFFLSISRTLEGALWANRLAYLGSVFLPMAMFLLLLNGLNLSYQKWVPGLLIALGIIVFLVAASPGFLTIYYKEVTLETIGGAAVLKKIYGPLHILYLLYLMSYFIGMVSLIVWALLKKKMESCAHAMILTGAVFVNIGVWLIEQLVDIQFEMLSISYIISELFLLGLSVLIRENEKLKESLNHTSEFTTTDDPLKASEQLTTPSWDVQATQASGSGIPQETPEEKAFQPAPYPEQYAIGLTELTRTERLIYDYYIDGKTTKEILVLLEIKENTLKFHNKNIYSKLGVSSRKQLIEIYKKSLQTL